MNKGATIDILVLGAGWTSQFLVPEFEEANLSYSLTTSKGKLNQHCIGKYPETNILAFRFQPASEVGSVINEDQYTRLPLARTIIVTFKIEGEGPCKTLIDTYSRTHPSQLQPNWIQFGSTGIYKEKPDVLVHGNNSDYDKTSRATAEAEFLSLGGSVFNLAGLWGDERVPWNWVKKIAPTKDKLREKKSLHLIHGADIARACVAMHRKFQAGKRFILTDKHVYDWWDLIDRWAEILEKDAAGADGTICEYKKWVAELMLDEGVYALPRDHQSMGRILDSRLTWQALGIQPQHILTGPTQGSSPDAKL